MTAPTEAKAPCPLAVFDSVLAFTEALEGPKGSLDGWLECNNEAEVRAHIKAYARAKVADLVEAYRAALDALDEIANTTSRSLVIGAETYSTSGHAACVRIANEAIDREAVNDTLAAFSEVRS
ncbi:MAG TPA: hypothetical protein VIN36_03095 [Thiobacillus sp.]